MRCEKKQALSRVERSVYLYNRTMRIILTLVFFVSIHFQLLSQHCESTVIIELKIHGRQSEIAWKTKGSVHTIEEDVISLAKMSEGKEIHGQWLPVPDHGRELC